jgi:hypothetical protein
MSNIGFSESPYDIITNVGWAERIGVIEITYSQYNEYSVSPTDPDVGFPGWDAGTLTEADYGDEYELAMEQIGDAGDTGIISENQIDNVWLVDGFVIGAFGDDFSAYVADGTAAFGYPPNIHVTHAQIQFTNSTVLQPDGHSVSYISGYEEITSAPPDFDFTGSEEYAWYRITTIPAMTAHLFRRSWLVNFKFGKTKRAEIFCGVVGFADVATQYTLKIYKSGTAFIVGSDGTLLPDPATEPLISQSGSVSSQVFGQIVEFDRNGFL